MGRKPVERSLIPLPELFPGFRGFSPEENKSARLREHLWEAARKARGARATPFYSIREVAKFFDVSVPTAAESFRRLAQEGVLIQVRGSMTLVAGDRAQPRIPVRGVVAVPIWLPGFMIFPDLRVFYVHLEEQLRRHNFVADLIFYRQSEEVEPEFARRVLSHHPDFVLWLAPVVADRQTVQMIADAGVRMITLTTEPLTVPGRQYRLNWETALERGLRQWKREGIERVLIPARRKHDASATFVLDAVVKRLGIPCEHPLVSDQDATPRQFIQGLYRDRRTGVIFDRDASYTYFCSAVPEAMAALIGRARVMVMRPINILPAFLCRATVDFVSPDWRDIAQRLATDLAAGKTAGGGSPVPFEARWRPHMDAGKLASHFGKE